MKINRLKPRINWRNCAIALIYLSVNFVHAAPQFEASILPIVKIDTGNRPILRTIRIAANMQIIDNGLRHMNYITDTPNGYDGRIEINIRGSSSATWRKKQYRLETQDSTGANLNVSLLGFPPENDWILNAPYIDKSFLRSVLAYKIARDMGRYASRTRYVEMMLNGQYHGVYILMEKIKRDKNRIAIAKLGPEENSGDDLTGGYIISIDRGGAGFPSQQPPFPGAYQQVWYRYVYPKPEDISQEQQAYIRDFFYAFENALNESSRASLTQLYDERIDLDTFVDFFIVNELGKNVDGYRLSTYFYKDKDSKDGRLKMGPVWDFNLAFGNANYYDGWNTANWELVQLLDSDAARTDMSQTPFWWRKLLADTTFTRAVARRWFTLRESVLAKENLLNFIDAVADTLREPAARNFEIWSPPGEYGEGFWPVPEIFYSFKNYQDEIDYLKLWLGKRIDWMDRNIDQLGRKYQQASLAQSTEFSVSPAHPNPFVNQTVINLNLPIAGHVTARLFDSLGKPLRLIFNGRKGAGEQYISWNGNGRNNLKASTGVYFIQIEYGASVKTIKTVYLR